MNKKKMIELFVYVVIVVVGIILLITSKAKEPSKQYGIIEERGVSYGSLRNNYGGKYE